MLLARVAVILAFLSAVHGWAQGSWRFANPRPHGNNIIDMEMINGVVWQIGDRGSVHTSGDLDSWTSHETGTRNSLRGITFYRGNVYISGEAGLILSGDSATSLSARSLNTGDWLESVAASPETIVAVGDNGAIYQSTDGANWTRRGNFTTWLRSVAYGEGQFVCAGEAGLIATSTDGITWQQRTATTVDLNRVVYIQDRFWIVGAGGTAVTNNFRNTFTAFSTGVTNELFAVAGNSSEIVLAGDQVVLLGTRTGGPWVKQTVGAIPNGAPLWPYYSALWDGRLFLLGGRTGMKVEGYRTIPLGPLQWFQDLQPTRNWLWSATRVDETFAAAGANGTIVTSVDGITWDREVVPTNTLGEIFLGIGGNNNALVTVGTAGTILTSPQIMTNVIITNSVGQILTNAISLLGLFWNAVNSTTTDDLQGIAANDSTFVATGAKGTILTSPNGTNWTRRTSGVASYLSGAAAGPNGFVVVGDVGVILQSATGSSWTRRTAPTSSWIYTVRYVGNRYVAVGQGGLILTSPDGVQWTARNSGTTEWINDVTYINGSWVAVAGSGWMITSADSVNWTAFKSITLRSLYGVVSDGSQAIAVGLEGVILRNQYVNPQTPVSILSIGVAGRNALFLFAGAAGQSFVLESRPSFAPGSSWTSEATLQISDQTGTLIHQRLINDRMRFFRTRVVQ